MVTTPNLAKRLRERITIQQPARVADAHGQMVETWTTFATVWAAIEPLQGREFFSAQQENAETKTRIRIRYREGVMPDMRVVYDSRYYNIRSVINPREHDREMQLMCTEGVNLG